MTLIVANGNHPILCLFATKNINPGEEILYNYGQKNYPWEKEVIKKQSFIT
jgi:hypothetical protein